jgi:Acetyltransferase (GNAT) family
MKGDSFSNASASADFIVGFVEVASTREHCFALTADVPFKEFRVKVTSLVVDSGHRRKGIASLLLSACARQSLIWSGCTELFLEVRNENEGARLFYDKMGFKECLGESCFNRSLQPLLSYSRITILTTSSQIDRRVSFFIAGAKGLVDKGNENVTLYILKNAS